MHWCDSIEFELVGTNSYPTRYEDGRKQFSLKNLRLQAGDCEFCAHLVDLIDYRLRHASATEDDVQNAQVTISVDGPRDIRNWSFGFEGVTQRKVLVVSVWAGKRDVEIVLQRAGPGGSVPRINKPKEAGEDTVTLLPPGSWYVPQPGDSVTWDDRPDERVSSLEPTFGRTRPLRIDFDTLGTWLRLCDEQHSICQNQDKPVNFPRFRLIDIKSRCITEIAGQERPRFATLSYVWGTKPFLRLNKENMTDLKKPGCLNDAALSLTIGDAVTVCEKLQIAYLWVDSLCIIQDDESDMIEMIDKMDSIYRESILTIIAASGLDAHSGIPGVRPGTRALQQRLLEVRGVQLIDSVDHKQFQFQTKFEEPHWIADSPWARRAWTFQEALVSRKSLFFTAEQVYWNCREGLLSEDTTEYFRSTEYTAQKGKRLDSEFDPLEYKHIATTFSTRRLTFEADVGRAYLGTQNHLNKKWGGHNFSWGLPHGAFGSFLMWERQFEPDLRMRKGTHPVVQLDGTVVKVPFPSWSWMAWTEGGQLIDFYGDEPDAHSPLFFVFDLATRLIVVRDGSHWRTHSKPLRDLLANETDSTEPGPSWKTEVTEEDLPLELHSTPSIRHSALVFYSETATVRYDPSASFKATSFLDTPDDLKMVSQKYPFSVKIGDTFHRILEEHQTSSDENKGLKEITLVAVFSGQMNKPKKLRGQYRLYCWPVTRKDGVRVRASGMSTVIFLKLWKTLPQRKWELVTML
ncbi:heterokaryon incompatibility protein-domain-containing protein [Thelonectria olida]|uniref:Heterokaryon incompatibility protein-domain-containing protein n=1 Tax=Thelonectria olida TaxID=1576542 RepID=A0A9P8VT11_9HYPO|nr:heterokaryon incompatibility protein-domain-containing protein [Thelonectria olida]